jgi:hypothetical protein
MTRRRVTEGIFRGVKNRTFFTAALQDSRAARKIPLLTRRRSKNTVVLHGVQTFVVLHA